MHLLMVFPVLALFAQAPRRTLETYDLRFLTEPVPQFSLESWPSAGNLFLELGLDRGASPIAFTAVTAEEPTASPIPPGLGLDPQALASLIRQNIAEDSWANALNSLEVKSTELRIVQTPEVHAAIGQFLAALRARRALMVTVDVAFVPWDSLGDAVISGGESLLSGEDFDAAVQRAGERGSRITLTAYNEQRIHGFSGRRSTRLVDTEVNQTGVLPVVNPVVKSLPLGFTVEVLPRAITGTSWYRLDLKATRLKEAGPAEAKSNFFADLEILPLSEESLVTTLFLPPEKAGLAGIFHAERPAREPLEFAVLARLRPTPVADISVSTPKAEEPFSLAAYACDFLLNPLPDEEPVFSADLLLRQVQTNLDPEAWRDQRASLAVDGSGRLLQVTARAATHEKVRAFLNDEIRKRASLVRFEARELEGPLEELLAARREAEGGTLLPAGWLSGPRMANFKETSRAVLAGAFGAAMKARAFESRGFIGEIHTVSGGTGFSISFAPDPELESAGSGLELEVQVHALHQPELLSLHLTFGRAQTRFERSAKLNALAEIAPAEAPPPSLPHGKESPKKEDSKPKPQASEETSPAVRPRTSLVWIPFAVDLPAQRQLRFETVLALPPARFAILRMEETEAGRGRMLIASVSRPSVPEERR